MDGCAHTSRRVQMQLMLPLALTLPRIRKHRRPMLQPSNIHHNGDDDIDYAQEHG
jgi:hypothetical protein